MELKFTDITVAVKLDEKTFKRFARFDMFALRKKWIRPATGREAVCLPSTSPANAQWSLEKLIEAWAVILEED